MIRKHCLTMVVVIFLIGFSACETANNQNEDGEEVATTYILVRHAEKANDGTKDPDLTGQGKERAERLSQMLLPTEVDAIYSTNYQRTRQTAAPLAGRLGLEINLYDPSGEKDFINLQKEMQGKTLLIVGHSNTIPAMVNQLVGEERISQLDENEYDKLFIVSVIKKQAKVTTLSY